MIVKIQDDNLNDKHIINAARFFYNAGGSILDCYKNIDDHNPTCIRLHHGDRIFFMNDAGQTVDSKRIILDEE